MGFSNGFERGCRPGQIAGRHLRLRLFLLPALALLLAACGQPGGYGRVPYGAPGYGTVGWAPTHYYPPPGPPEDPWGPYIREAAGQYNVPEQWVRAVMQQESGGEEQAVSPVGAMGLMQVMPETYEGLRERNGLGSDPYDPHNNILAGTAYIREMYDRFGAPGFLAAYNAGPDRVDAYLAGTSILPDETVNYLASVTPNLGNAVPLSGPMATYAIVGAGGANRAGPDAASLAAGCDLSAAYDPNHPCSSLMRAATAPTPVQQALAVQTGAGGCDLSAAYDPAHPCTSVGAVAAASASPPPAQPVLVAQTGTAGCDLNTTYTPNHPCTSVNRAVAAARPPQALIRPSASGGCDPNAAYDLDNPCRQIAPISSNIQLASAGGCDPNAAFDPDHPCRRPASALADVSLPPTIAPSASAISGADRYPAEPVPHSARAVAISAGSHLLAMPDRDWGIQVGAFASPALAHAVAEAARSQAPGQLRAAAIALPPIANSGSVLYRARLVNLSASAAENACTNLNRRQLPCVVVEPNRS
ncbi:MAG TPA: lytic transglycosylase domain-containing protein [Stellaceae bacterium]